MNLWKKLFGITGGVRPATDLLSAIEAPGIPDSWRRIQAQAEKNAAAYEAAFPFVPKNWSSAVNRETGKQSAGHILPTWDVQAKPPKNAAWDRGNIGSPLPFQSDFWLLPTAEMDSVNGLESVKGFITALPIHWTEGENNRIPFPSALLTQNDIKPMQPAAGIEAGTTTIFGEAESRFIPNPEPSA
jgi:phospholipase D1/2